MSAKNKSFVLVFILGLSLILSGCIPLVSSELSVNIGLQEAWTFDIVITPMQGYDGQLLNEMNSQFADSQELKDAGVTVKVTSESITPEGYTPIKTSIKGKGYEVLNQILGNTAISVEDTSGQKLLHFDLDMGAAGTAQSTTFTLSGGKILNHNGTLINDHTVVWHNYTGSIQATMVEPSLLDYWLYAAIAVILVMMVLFILLLVMGLTRLSKSKKMKARSMVHSKICIQCRNTIPAHAVFCPSCGAQQKRQGE